MQTIQLPPEGEGTLRAFSRIGYELPVAIADIVDNSIDAGASKVAVTIIRNDREVTAVVIADDGCGMDLPTMRRGMQFAGNTQHAAGDLGAFGMGLKSASFSQAKILTVISRREGATVASRWSLGSIGKDWNLQILNSEGAAKIFNMAAVKDPQSPNGTIVLWQELDRLVVGNGVDALDEFLATAMPRLETHLGLIFHRFLQTGKLSISVTVRHERRSMALPREVRPYDPFSYPRTGVDGWPKTLRTELPNLGEIQLVAHIWPPGMETDAFLLGTKRGAEFQGLYFFRNNRVIQAGGWNGVIKTNFDPELVHSRVAVELPNKGLDVNVQKSAIQVTAAQRQALLAATDGHVDLAGYLETARAAYRASRRANTSGERPIVVPGAGVPAPVRRLAIRRLAKDAAIDEVEFEWIELDDDVFFDLDIPDTKIFLNSKYRHDILAGSRASPADAPLVKMLLFLLFMKDFDRVRVSS